MRVWRIVRSRHAEEAFSGEGARRYSGRWHHAGRPAVYTATSRPLALLEILVHVDFEDAPTDFVLIPADVPGECVESLEDDDLPEGWDFLPATEASRDLGSTWLRERHSPGLLVPSVVLPQERNVLLNPLHPDFDRVEIGRPEPLDLDPRLIP